MSIEIPGVFHNDPAMSSIDLERINILDEKSSSDIWNKYVSAKNRHFMLLDDDEWPSKITNNEIWHNWSNEWNNDDKQPYKLALESLKIPTQSKLYVLWMKEIGIETNWEVFCNNWLNFLYEDEGCILVIPNVNTSVIMSNGLAWYGGRNEEET